MGRRKTFVASGPEASHRLLSELERYLLEDCGGEVGVKVLIKDAETFVAALNPYRELPISK